MLCALIISNKYLITTASSSREIFDSSSFTHGSSLGEESLLIYSEKYDLSIGFTLFAQSAIIITVAYTSYFQYKGGENMEVLEMTEKEMMQKNVEEFERLQDYMVSCEKDSEAYKKMKRRYTALKVILTASGINLTELDIIKE